ncbi:MlaD family protein [Aldersonia kunmingensis]|uniref:MlaD family protein n=1 Tax=Aldersonia kunmingensis TaxID=408066 RepID=UPI00082D0366|nr:MlaD family protein [Aldersonia kunmingensis]
MSRTGRRTLGARTSLALLVVISLALTAYLAVGILHLDPLRENNTVRVSLPQSGGLQPHSRVLYNGIEVGEVTEIRTRADSLQATIVVDAGEQIPVASEIRVANLSLVGEQYIEFSSPDDIGPYIADGALINNNVDAGTTVSDMLASVSNLLGQLDPDTINSLATTITDGWLGRDADLATIGEFSRRTARTVTAYESEFAGLFDNAQSLLAASDQAQVGEAMRIAAPKLAAMNIPFATLWSLFPGLAEASEGGVGWYDVVIPFTLKIGEYLQKTMPEAAAVIAVLQPYLNAAAPGMRTDLGALVERGLQVVDENGVVRLKVAMPN